MYCACSGDVHTSYSHKNASEGVTGLLVNRKCRHLLVLLQANDIVSFAETFQGKNDRWNITLNIITLMTDVIYCISCHVMCYILCH